MSAFLTLIFIIGAICTLWQLYLALAGLILLWKNPQSHVTISFFPGLIAAICVIVSWFVIYFV